MLLFTGNKMSRSCCTGQGHGHLIIKISQNIGQVHAYFVYNYLNIRKDESNSCKLVADWLIVLLLLCTVDEYQGHVAQVEVIPM